MYKVTIKNNETEEVRIRKMDLKWNEASVYWWTEGNFGCDCNREWEFQRAGNEKISDDPKCGEDRFTVLYVELPDGTKIDID